MKIGIFGGTFSPIHNGHVLSARKFFKECALDRLYIIPDRIPPHKNAAENDDPLLRFEMARLAFCHEPGYGEKIFVSDIELMREGKSYTYDTLKQFENEGELFLLCGTDMLMSFETWFRFSDIFKMCTLAVSVRDVQSEAEKIKVDEKVKYFSENFGAKIILLGGQPYPASSTEIRGIIKSGGDASGYLPHDVWEFIKEKRLYR